MKNLKKTRGWLVMAAALTVGLSACSSSEDSIIEQPANPTEKTYTMTVTASKGEDNALARAIAAAGSDGETRALSLSSDGKSITAAWKAGEAVTVHNDTRNTDLGGTLTAQTDGATTTLTGTLTGNVAPGDVLTLKFLSPAYNTQDGTLTGTTASIDKTCDYATATVTVATANDGKITTTGDADFQNRQAIIKFTLTNKSNSATLSPTALTVAYGASEVTLTDIPAATYSKNGAGVVFVAVPTDGGTAQTVTLTAIVGDDTYNYTRSGVTFEDGQYYAISVKMTRPTEINLADLNNSYTAKDGDVLTGTLSENSKLTIASGATVTLKDATIPGGHDSAKPWAGITCLGDATIILSGTNSVKGYYINYAGIQAGPSGTTLTIQGSGKLTATYGGVINGSKSAGIGGGQDQTVGNIVIAGGDITATGNLGGAGIGSGLKYNSTTSCGYITISGGIVTATVNGAGAGIGSGNLANCGSITITGGTVTATGDNRGAGIGSGSDGTCGNITISGGTVTATGGSLYNSGTGNYLYGAGIGSGNQGRCGNITITAPATGTATGGTGSTYDIGAGRNGTVGTVKVAPSTISGRINGGYNYESVTAEAVGKLIAADGLIYATASEADAAGTSPIAMICHVGAAGSADASNASYHILAIALKDALNDAKKSYMAWCASNGAETCLSTQQKNWDEANKSDIHGIGYTTALVDHIGGIHTAPAAQAAVNNNGTATLAGGSGWFLPTIGQWNLMLTGLLGGDGLTTSEQDAYKAAAVNAKFAAAGLSSSQYDELSGYYWSSTEYNKTYVWRYNSDKGLATREGYNKSGSSYVRAVLAF